jgi:hypothetical protein
MTKIEQLDMCEMCLGTGEIEILEHVVGDSIGAGGYYEGSGRFRKCDCRELVEVN